MLPRPGFRPPRPPRADKALSPKKPPKPPSTAHKVAAGVTVGALVIFSLVGLQAVSRLRAEPSLTEVTLSGALTAIDEGKVARLHLDDGSRRATLILVNGTKVITAYPIDGGDELTTKALDNQVKFTASPERSGRSLWLNMLINLLPVVLLIAFFIFFMGPRMGLGKGTKKSRKPAEVPETRFSDVVGVDEAVSELAEVVEFLHAPERFVNAGARVPHGFLLVGPPGTGKTLLARAVAGEAGVPFFALSGSDFVETFVGVGASRVRQVFDSARKLGRAIIFIDEIDAVGKTRNAGPSAGGGAEERENTLNQLLVEMDGFTQSGIIVLAATNRGDVLDPALTRPGRFDRRIVVPAPDRVGRTKILYHYAKTRKFATDVDLVSLGRRTPGLTGADLSYLINEAALVAARQNSDVITSAHLDDALATAVLGRERRSAVITERDRRITAWHEAGHAVTALVLPHADDPVSVTIIPRGGAGGVTWMGGNDHSFLTRSEAEARLVVSMGGRAAEEVHLDGDFTQGASSDFAAATSLATAMVTEYGMSDLGVACRAATALGAHSDEVNTTVGAILERALAKSREVVAANLPLTEAIVQELLIEETVRREDLLAMAIHYGARVPVTPDAEAAAQDRELELAGYSSGATFKTQIAMTPRSPSSAVPGPTADRVAGSVAKPVRAVSSWRASRLQASEESAQAGTTSP